jgi:glycosyltransferase involved in cell wall biosynthesis
MLRTAALQHSAIRKRLYYLAVEYRTIRNASAIAVFNDVEEHEASEFLNFTPTFIRVPNGLSLPETLTWTSEHDSLALPRTAVQKVMLFIGRLHWSKDLILQARAFTMVATSMPDLVWVLAGPDAGEWARIVPIIKKAGLEQRVIRTGEIPHAACFRLLAHGDVFVMTSRHEGHSMALNEALVSGIPVVVTNGASFPGLAGTADVQVVEPEPRQVALAIAKALNARRDGQKGCIRRGISATLNWNTAVDNLLRAYRQWGVLA